MLTSNGSRNKDLDWCQKRLISDLILEVDLENDVLKDIRVYSNDEIENMLLEHTPFMQNMISQGLVYEL